MIKDRDTDQRGKLESNHHKKSRVHHCTRDFRFHTTNCLQVLPQQALVEELVSNFNHRNETEDVVEIILQACQTMSQQRIGALIVLEQEVGLKNYSDRGTQINATVSEPLLLSIFHHTHRL